MMRVSPRMWLALTAFAVMASIVAVTTVASQQSHRSSNPAAARFLSALGRLRVEPRHHDRSYDRSRFGTAWSDDSDAQGAHNGCDTRNDILTRDLRDRRFTSTDKCPKAIDAGEFRSPYTGTWMRFRRVTAAAVQIDHVVALSYAWDMGAKEWSDRLRLTFANDPANLVAVDGPSNQDKGDGPPSRWMPANKGFHCRYAAQFITVASAYGLALDPDSVGVLRTALRRC